MEKVIQKLEAEALKYRGFAERFKREGYIESFQVNLRYAHGIEFAIDQIKRVKG